MLELGQRDHAGFLAGHVEEHVALEAELGRPERVPVVAAVLVDGHLFLPRDEVVVEVAGVGAEEPRAAHVAGHGQAAGHVVPRAAERIGGARVPVAEQGLLEMGWPGCAGGGEVGRVLAVPAQPHALAGALVGGEGGLGRVGVLDGHLERGLAFVGGPRNARLAARAVLQRRRGDGDLRQLVELLEAQPRLVAQRLPHDAAIVALVADGVGAPRGDGRVPVGGGHERDAAVEFVVGDEVVARLVGRQLAGEFVGFEPGAAEAAAGLAVLGGAGRAEDQAFAGREGGGRQREVEAPDVRVGVAGALEEGVLHRGEVGVAPALEPDPGYWL